MLSEEEVRHVAKLARIKLSDEEVKRFAGQLSNVLDYMKNLEKVDTDGVEASSQVTGLVNVMRADEIKGGAPKREALLECSELELDTKQIRVKKTI